MTEKLLEGMSLQIHDFMLTTKYLRNPLARNLYFEKNQSCKNLCTTISEKQGVHVCVRFACGEDLSHGPQGPSKNRESKAGRISSDGSQILMSEMKC